MVFAGGGEAGEVVYCRNGETNFGEKEDEKGVQDPNIWILDRREAELAPARLIVKNDAISNQQEAKTARMEVNKTHTGSCINTVMYASKSLPLLGYTDGAFSYP